MIFQSFAVLLPCSTFKEIIKYGMFNLSLKFKPISPWHFTVFRLPDPSLDVPIIEKILFRLFCNIFCTIFPPISSPMCPPAIYKVNNNTQAQNVVV